MTRLDPVHSGEAFSATDRRDRNSLILGMLLRILRSKVCDSDPPLIRNRRQSHD